MRRRPALGVCSALECACPVRDVYDVYGTRVRRALTKREPTLEPLDIPDEEVVGAHHRADSLSDAHTLITDWREGAHR